jgi:hypothetical protein
LPYFINGVLEMTPGELNIPIPGNDRALPEGSPDADQISRIAANIPLRTIVLGIEPKFDAKMNLAIDIIAEEMGPVFDKMEPRFRAGLAMVFARKYTLKQLNDMSAFFSTPSGTAFAADYMTAFMEPELLRQTAGIMPDLVKIAPTLEARLKAALTPPKAEEASDEGKDNK